MSERVGALSELVVVRPHGMADRVFTLPVPVNTWTWSMSSRSSCELEIDELTCDRERRLPNQRAFPLWFVVCSCPGGCVVCAYTGFVSRAESKQIGQRDHAPPRPAAGPPLSESRT